MEDPEVEVIVDPESAFSRPDPTAQWSLAALILGIGARLLGVAELLAPPEADDEYPYDYRAVAPAPGALRDDEVFSLLARSGLTSVIAALTTTPPGVLPIGVSAENGDALRGLWSAGQDGDTVASAALVRACVTHEFEPVRVAGSAIWSLANPADVSAGTALFQALDSSSESVRGIARAVLQSDGYGGVQLEPPPRDQPPAGPDQVRPVSLMVHGTWAYDERWWRPGVGDFHGYIKSAVRPNLWARPSVYYWSGRYESSDRDWAIYDLLSWAGQHCPRGVDTVFAHSYGGHVAMRAVAQGLRPRTLVLLSTPFYADDRPSLMRVLHSCKVVSFRTKYDLVLRADKIARFVRNPLRPKPISPPFREIQIGGFFTGHSATHDPDIWRKKGLAARI
jgi:hypothetical protein